MVLVGFACGGGIGSSSPAVRLFPTLARTAPVFAEEHLSRFFSMWSSSAIRDTPAEFDEGGDRRSAWAMGEGLLSRRHLPRPSC